MKIGVLTSSRADFGIYLPLLNQLKNDDVFNVQIIAFGTHLSEAHGSTISEIHNSGFTNVVEVSTKVDDTDANAVANCYSDVLTKFCSIWNQHKFDLVLCLGDRYEMSAAVQAGIPYGIQFAHFHGGETSLGAIDNIYRHQITLASKYHFTATEEFSDRVKEIIDHDENLVFNVGSMSLSDLTSMSLISYDELMMKYELPNSKYILCTFHPETFDTESNVLFAEEMYQSMELIEPTTHLLVSMPNADTNGNVYRNALKKFKLQYPNRITLVESFGKINYFSAMQNAEFLMGNSSSGIIEAASFGKMVINVGDRQKGRLQSGNVIDVPFKASEIVRETKKLTANPITFSGKNKYVQKNTIENIIVTLRKIANGELS